MALQTSFSIFIYSSLITCFYCMPNADIYSHVKAFFISNSNILTPNIGPLLRKHNHKHSRRSRSQWVECLVNQCSVLLWASAYVYSITHFMRKKKMKGFNNLHIRYHTIHFSLCVVVFMKKNELLLFQGYVWKNNESITSRLLLLIGIILLHMFTTWRFS